MVDQRDTLQYMGAPLYYADDFFDGRATYQVKTICSKIDACDGRTDGVQILYWSSRKDEISHARNYHSVLDRPLHGRRWFHFSSTLGVQRPRAGYRTDIELKIVGVW